MKKPSFFFLSTLAIVSVLAAGLAACADQQSSQTGSETNDTATMTDTSSSMTAAPTSSSGSGAVKVKQSSKIGPYLTDADGRTLYYFLKDKKGSGSSTCTQACAQAWPPFTVSQGSPTARGEAKSNMLGTIQRQGGAPHQVTYNGKPLYYYAQDQGPGDLKGQDIKGFGAEWYAVTPQGKPAGHEQEE